MDNQTVPTQDDNERINAIADFLWERYTEPTAENKTIARMRNAIFHEMTCTDPAHGHGIVQAAYLKDNAGIDNAN